MGDYGSIQDHADAILGLLHGTPNLAVFPAPNGGPETVPAGTQPPYVSVHMTGDRPAGGRLDRRSTRMVVRVYVHCVGANDIAARAVSDLVAGVLLDARPLIVGRSTRPIRHQLSQPPRTDESTGVLVSTLTEVYVLETTPGRAVA